MSTLYDGFNIMEVDEETKKIVESYISYSQHKLLSNNSLLGIIPDLVTHICILYYYRTHSIYEWKVTDSNQLENIKHAVPGQSFNHHFKLHKLDWFLKFYPNGTKQSKQGNVFLLLYLRSTPEIFKMSATCKVWLSELDKGREHYKDFNDKNKYTGWRSGLVKTAEIAPLKQLTFQVTIQIFEIYDKDQQNVTNKYIGLGIDSKQTICYLRKELEAEKRKVQELMIEVDELRKPSISEQSVTMSHCNLLMLEHNYSHSMHDMDDEKKMDDISISYKSYNSNINHHHFNNNHQNKPYINSPRLLHEDICKIKFEDWLCNVVKLGQYLNLFKEKEYNDIRMIEFFDEDAVENDIGIKKKLHRKLVMKKAKEFRDLQMDFSVIFEKNIQLKIHKDVLEQHGILNLKDLKNDIKTKQSLKTILGKNGNDKSVEMIWELANV